MTKLTKLTLKNFKSFKKAEIPISKGFTAIVGSNGSGKSNVLDALLFVLGITSLKTLRASKLIDLVNNNSKEGYAKVDLTLKHEDRQYELSRMIDRQGKSVYRLDGKRTTLNEVNSLLLELGIDITGHNIVTQGDITKIIEMSPLERRAIIDTIAGLSEFDEKKQEALKELEKVDSRIKEATIIMNERNAFLIELEEEMKAAKEFGGLEGEKKRIKATIITRELYSIEKRMREIDSEITELEKIKETSDTAVTQMRTELTELKAKSNEMNRQIMKDSESLYITIGRSFEEKKAKWGLEKEKISLQEDIIHTAEKKIAQNNKLKEELVLKQQNLKASISDTEEELAQLEKTIKELTQKKTALAHIVRSKGAEAEVQEKQIDTFTKNLDEAQKELFETTSAEKQWRRTAQLYMIRQGELEKEQQLVNEKLATIATKKKRIEELTQGKNLAHEITALEGQVQEALEKKHKNKALLDEAKKAVQDLSTASSKCPICDADLHEERKSQIVGHKRSHIGALEKEEAELREQLQKVHAALAKTKENHTTVTMLTAECANETELTKRRGEIQAQLKELAAIMNQSALEEILQKKQKAEQKVTELTVIRTDAKQKLAAFRAQDVFEEYAALNTTLDASMNEKAALESTIRDTESEQHALASRITALEKDNREHEKGIAESRKEIATKTESMNALDTEIKAKEAELKEAKKKSTALLSDKEKLDKHIERNEREIMNETGKARKVELRINDFRIEKSRIEVRENDLREEGKGFENEVPISEKSVDELKKQLDTVEKRLLEIGAVNLKAVDNFNELKLEVDDIQKKATTLNEERMAVLDMIDKIEVKRTAVFMECFNEVNKNFQEMFFKFFNGEGKLTFTDTEKPLESGLLIEARHKMNKLQNIDSMSGGEKTLTALAFMFAIQLFSPAPFYAFDEADAALDKENSAKMGNLIEMIAAKSQFISVTHNDTITKKADQIIGVALAKDGSSVIGLKLKNQES